MNFPQFWAKAVTKDMSCWRWSAHSHAEAQQLANQAVQQLAERFQNGNYPPKQGGYYPDRPFREEVLHEVKNDAGQIAAVVTRNSYGCQVLNTARVMFVDIDLPEPGSSGGLLQRIFGRRSTSSSAHSSESAVQKIENWSRQHPEWGWRIYRTRAGLRLLATQGPVDPDSKISQEIFESFDADPLYRKLCFSQKCFRARLTPKPWRCGIRSRPERWPLLDARAEKRFQKWEAQYQSYSFNWATCKLLQVIGNPQIHPEVQMIIQLHDGPARVESNLPLA